MNLGRSNSRLYAKLGKFVFVLVVLFLMMGCRHTLPMPTSDCELRGVDHATKGLSWGSLVSKSCAFSSGLCKTEVTKITVLNPAEIDITKYQNIAFAEIGGNAGADFSAALMEEMVKNKDINVVDRNQLASHLKELGISGEDLFDQSSRIKLGKMLPGTVLVFGEINYDYKETVDQSRDVCIDPETKRSYQCNETTRTGSASVKGRIYITETETGRQIQVKRISTSVTDSASTRVGTTRRFNSNELQDQAVEKAANELLRSIIPWKEYRTVIFYKDGDVPKLERGIAEAQAGKLQNAKKYFADAIADIESSGNFDNEDLAAAKFDLGVIKTYEREHDQAEKLFMEVEDLALKVFPVRTMRRINDCLKERDARLTTASLSTSTRYLCG